MGNRGMLDRYPRRRASFSALRKPLWWVTGLAIFWGRCSSLLLRATTVPGSGAVSACTHERDSAGG
jgi:hypothetical protein